MNVFQADPLSGFRFRVYLQGVLLGFSKVTSLEDFVETEALPEGGVNDHVHSLLAPVKSERTMIFERGTAGRGISSKLLTLRFRVGERIPGDITIAVTGREGAPRELFLVHGALVKKWSCSDLDAMSSSLLIERFEVNYESIGRTLLPYTDI